MAHLQKKFQLGFAPLFYLSFFIVILIHYVHVLLVCWIIIAEDALEKFPCNLLVIFPS